MTDRCSEGSPVFWTWMDTLPPDSQQRLKKAQTDDAELVKETNARYTAEFDKNALIFYGVMMALFLFALKLSGIHTVNEKSPQSCDQRHSRGKSSDSHLDRLQLAL